MCTQSEQQSGTWYLNTLPVPKHFIHGKDKVLPTFFKIVNSIIIK